MKAIGTPRNPDGSPNYAYLQLGRWWENTDANGMGRGWVRDSRFGPGQVIPGTNRAAQRKAKPHA